MSAPVPADAIARVRHRFLAEPGTVADPRRHLARLLREEAPLLSDEEVGRGATLLARDLVGLGPLDALLEDPDVADVLVNGPGPVWVERRGGLEPTSVVVDRGQIARWIERLVGPLGLVADRSRPVVDARLADGTRVAVVLDPLAVDGPVLAVRRHRTVPVGLGAFGPQALVDVLVGAVADRRNVVVYGPTGSGKTTLLNALGALVPAEERIVTIEDTAELRIPHPHVVRLEARPGTAEGAGATGVRELVRAALRLRPDRIVVGEVRGAEALDMVWALSTGHRGSLSTVHADGPLDVLRRLETMCCSAPEHLPLAAVRAQVASAVDVAVGVRRGPDGSRRVVAVHAVRGPDAVEDLFVA